jgi:hypothetical protein
MDDESLHQILREEEAIKLFKHLIPERPSGKKRGARR